MIGKKTSKAGKAAGAVLVIALLAVSGAFMLFYRFGILFERPVTVENEDELIEALISGFDTGYESVVVKTKGLPFDESRIASYISSEISNDAEDLCILPESYSVSGMDLIGLWKFELFFTGVKNETVRGEGTFLGEKTQKEEPSAAEEIFSCSREEIAQAKHQVSEALDRITAEITAETAAVQGSAADLYRAVFDYLCTHVEYDYELSAAIMQGDYSSPLRKNRGSYGALIEGRTVCSGYAAAYKAICDRLGLDCWVVSSTDHAWNLIRVDGQVYCVDATSGDQETWIADQFFMVDPSVYETEYGYRPEPSCYIPARFLS